jgi:hypothetical protein
MPNKGYSGHQDRQYNLPSPRKSASVSDITAFSAFLALLVFFLIAIFRALWCRNTVFTGLRA